MNNATADITANAPAHPSIKAANVEDVQRLVNASPKLLPHGAKTKPVLLSTPEAVTLLDMTAISGLLEYDPGEYTFTAYAGTRIRDIAATLATHGQYLPFDPPLVEDGATLGGTIAAGLSGSNRYRFGGLRDFILGVTLVDGQGRVVRGGGKVVKNAAGFDLPKLMVGSMGRLGILISASFKVFPAPPATATLRAILPDLRDALTAMARLMGGPYDLEALDLLPQSDGTTHLLVRIGGPANVLPARLERLAAQVGTGEAIADDLDLWAGLREFTWVDQRHQLVKVATTPQSLPILDRALHAANAARHYAVGGNLAWIGWPHDPAALHKLLTEQGARGLILRGNAEQALVGLPLHNAFQARLRAALDPHQRFVDFE